MSELRFPSQFTDDRARAAAIEQSRAADARHLFRLVEEIFTYPLNATKEISEHLSRAPLPGTNFHVIKAQLGPQGLAMHVVDPSTGQESIVKISRPFHHVYVNEPDAVVLPAKDTPLTQAEWTNIWSWTTTARGSTTASDSTIERCSSC